MTVISKSISSTGNRKIFTVSVWVKRANGISGGNGSIFCVGTANSDSGKFRFVIDSSNRVKVEGGSTNFRTSEAVLTDQFGWYHLVCAVDSTDSNAITE